jgi:hypothetical protein
MSDSSWSIRPATAEDGEFLADMGPFLPGRRTCLRVRQLRRPGTGDRRCRRVARQGRGLTVIDPEARIFTPSNPAGRYAAVCRCDCGNPDPVTVSLGNLTMPKGIKSCGCLLHNPPPNCSHGLSRHPLYGTWKMMLARCTNEKHKEFKNYGGRDTPIRVADRWNPDVVGHKMAVTLFIADIERWLGPRPSKGHSLDRIQNDYDYRLDNMHWATPAEQNRNQRRTKLTQADADEIRQL